MPDFQRNGGSADVTQQMIDTAKQQIDDYMERIPDFDESRYKGRGIVMIAGGPKYIACAYVNVNMVRDTGCTLPIELWHIGAFEMDDRAKALFDGLGVEFVDCMDKLAEVPSRRVGGWEMNPYAIIHSRFEEIIFLDADNIPLIDLEELFDWPQYRERHAVFWPDFGRLGPERSIWKLLQIEYRDECEFESGQIVVNKRECWNELNLTMCLNEYSDTYYQHIWGDKDTYHMAWRYLGTEYAMTPHLIHRLRSTMCQHDFSGNIVFQHRNMDKFRLERTNATIQGFRREPECFAHLERLRELWDGVIELPLPTCREELVATAELSNRTVEYILDDKPPRRMEFKSDGTIGEGSMEMERQWYIKKYGEALTLHICNHKVTATLIDDGAGAWKGQWLGNEMFATTIRMTDKSSLEAMDNVQMTKRLAGQDYLYVRVGFDRSACRFTEGGVVEGLGANERFWWVRTVNGVPVLNIAGSVKATPICMLQECRDGIWRGLWTAHERMQIELIPRKDP